MKDYFDTLMKEQLQEMSGSKDAWTLELRKFAVMEVDSPNFESVTIEKLRALDKPIKLQKYNYCI